MAANILRLKPLEFAHILDLNSNITYVEIGPSSLILQENQVVVFGPASFVVIPPGHYCVVANPVKLPVIYGKQAELKFAQEEVRLHQEPFPLYPGEELKGANKADYKGCIKKLPVVLHGTALKVQALVDFHDGKVQRAAGEEWHVEGPCTYYPCPECKEKDTVISIVINYGMALRLQAQRDLLDKNGKFRVTGEEWLVKKPGAYLPGVYERVVKLESGYTLTLNDALHMCASINLVDGLLTPRVAGEEWLVTSEETPLYIPEVGEDIVKQISRTVLSKDQFCVVLNPVENGKQCFGKRQLRKGQTSFFLQPGEELENGIQNAYLLEYDEALILSAAAEFEDFSVNPPIQRKPGDLWMIRGSQVYIPPVEVDVKLKRTPIALAKNEGIYVQDQKNGKVFTVLGPISYLLTETETLWAKELSPLTVKMLANGGCWGDEDIRKLAYFESSVDPVYANEKRDKTRIVTYRVPPNAAVQVFDHQKQTARVVFGPNLVVLEPSEDFNILNLSAGKPKKEGALKSLAIMLGPDYITDVIEVETLDHARLSIKYAANNKFEVEIGNKVSEAKIFSVPDYIGFATKSIASRIRGQVARTSFDEFHRYSTRIVKEAVFGFDDEGNVRHALYFSENGLKVTNIDVQSIEPVDAHMRDSLLKSVQLAIEISTQSIERSAVHEAARHEQTAKGNLDKNRLFNEKAAEEERRRLYELRAVTAAVESSGQAIAEAKALAERALIEGKTAIEVAKLRTEAESIEAEAKLHSLEQQRKAEIDYIKTVNQMEIEKAKSLADIETQKSSAMINVIGSDVVRIIADAGMVAKMNMLQGLGIKSTLITDGKTPINLYQAPNGNIYPVR